MTVLGMAGLCSHPETYRERRTSAHGIKNVPHFVCDRCGGAWPVIDRDRDGQIRARFCGVVRKLKATRQPVHEQKKQTRSLR